MSPDLIRPSKIYNNGKGLRQIFDMCRRSFPANQIHAMFTQFAFIGCVRAGLTRLDKRLVGVFDLK